MKTMQITTASVTAGLAAALLAGAVWAQHANINWDDYVGNADLVTGWVLASADDPLLGASWPAAGWLRIPGRPPPLVGGEAFAYCAEAG